MITKELLFEMLKAMLMIRTIEERMAEDFIATKTFSMVHFPIGEEGSAVGVAFARDKKDILFGNHRSHGHYLALGGNLEKMVHEVYGNTEGCCGGYGGSMHLLDRSVGFVGTTSILGSVAPIGVGLAFSQKNMESGGVAFVFIGDGSAEEGAFYEAVNLAGLMRCPLIFILEDNRYCVNSPHKDRKSPDYNIKSVINGLGALYERVSGQRVWDVFEVVKKMREIVIKNNCPAVIHIDLLRNYGHSSPLKEPDMPYRVGDDMEYRKNNCCIENLKRYMMELGVNKERVESYERDVIGDAVNNFMEIRKKFEVRQ
jgi:pyruvate dehydrogenase E1 component alpha subunit